MVYGLALERPLGQLPLQRAPMHPQHTRGGRDIARVLGEHAVDVADRYFERPFLRWQQWR